MDTLMVLTGIALLIGLFTLIRPVRNEDDVLVVHTEPIVSGKKRDTFSGYSGCF